jgi:hypothetical protein
VQIRGLMGFIGLNSMVPQNENAVFMDASIENIFDQENSWDH